MADSTNDRRRQFLPPHGILGFIELLGAAILVGGLAAAAGIGAMTFGSASPGPTIEPPYLLSHDQASRLMARVFEASLYVEAGAVGLMALANLAGRRLVRSGLVLATAGVCVFGHDTLGTQMREIREAHGGSLSALPKDDKDRIAFGKRHGLYNVVALALVISGLGTFASHARKGA